MFSFLKHLFMYQFLIISLDTPMYLVLIHDLGLKETRESSKGMGSQTDQKWTNYRQN